LLNGPTRSIPYLAKGHGVVRAPSSEDGALNTS
jgi:hypothetical protein